MIARAVKGLVLGAVAGAVIGMALIASAWAMWAMVVYPAVTFAVWVTLFSFAGACDAVRWRAKRRRS